MGLSDSWINHIEQGKMDVDNRQAIRLVEAYGFFSREYELLLAGSELPYLSIKDACKTMIDQFDETKLHIEIRASTLLAIRATEQLRNQPDIAPRADLSSYQKLPLFEQSSPPRIPGRRFSLS